MSHLEGAFGTFPLLGEWWFSLNLPQSADTTVVLALGSKTLPEARHRSIRKLCKVHLL